MAQPIWNNSTKSYSIESKPDVKDRIQIEVGDSQDSSAFFPQMKMMRWDNEANVSFRLVDTFIPGNVTYSDDGNGTITWQKKQGQNIWTAKFYENWGTPEGAYKFVELTLPAKPPTNQISFTTTSKDVDFFYQPPLTQQEIDEGSIRPDEVVGSYAIYSKSSGGMNRADGKDYKVGKVGHLYRAKLIDANNNSIWADYNTDLNTTGILTITVDQTWLDNAVYPVVLDPTFGYTSIGASATSGTFDTLKGLPGTPAESGTVSSISVYWKTGTTDNGPADVALYVNSDKSFVAGSNVGYTPTPDDWNTISLSTSVTNQEYLVCTWGEEYSIATDTLTNSSYASTGLNYTTPNPSWPNPASLSLNPNKISIYATYTASGGGTNIQLNIGDTWKSVSAVQINIGDVWKSVTHAWVNIGDTWKSIFTFIIVVLFGKLK